MDVYIYIMFVHVQTDTPSTRFTVFANASTHKSIAANPRTTTLHKPQPGRSLISNRETSKARCLGHHTTDTTTIHRHTHTHTIIPTQHTAGAVLSGPCVCPCFAAFAINCVSSRRSKPPRDGQQCCRFE